MLCGQVGMHGSDARIIESCRYALGLHDLSVWGLHHKGACSMQYAQSASMYCGSGMARVGALPSCFCQYDPHSLIIDIMVDGAGGIGSSSYACHEDIGIVTTYFFLQLPFYLF